MLNSWTGQNTASVFLTSYNCCMQINIDDEMMIMMVMMNGLSSDL